MNTTAQSDRCHAHRFAHPAYPDPSDETPDERLEALQDMHARFLAVARHRPTPITAASFPTVRETWARMGLGWAG